MQKKKVRCQGKGHVYKEEKVTVCKGEVKKETKEIR
jgi:hypothetical protein